MKPSKFMATFCIGSIFCMGSIHAHESSRMAALDHIVGVLTDSNQPENKRYVGIWIGTLTPQGTYLKGYGKTSKASSEAPSENTIFEIGSITKTFTAILLAKSGLDRNRGIKAFLPAWKIPTKSQSITLNHLASHTSGLPSIGSDIESLDDFLNYTPEKLASWLSTYQLKKSPGANYEYSNVGFGLLEFILSQQSKNTYEDAVNAITDELGMTDTVVHLSPEQKKRLSQAHDASGAENAYWNWGKNSTLEGAGALKSTGSDMIKYLKANLEAPNTSLGNAISESHRETFRIDDQLSVALAWRISKSSGVVWHDGGTGGFQSFIGFDKVKKVGVVILANSALEDTDHKPDGRINETGMKILSLLAN